MYLLINKCVTVTAVILSNFSRHYLRNRSTSDISVLGYIGVLQGKEHSAEVCKFPPGHLVDNNNPTETYLVLLARRISHVRCDKGAVMKLPAMWARLCSSLYDNIFSTRCFIIRAFRG